MADLDTGVIARVIFDEAVMIYQHQATMLDRCMFYQPSAKELQHTTGRGNRNENEFWRPVQQYATDIVGWDISTKKTKQGIIELGYHASLNLPQNDIIELRADDVRDEQFWKRRGQEAAMTLGTNLNRKVAELVVRHGSLFYQHDTTGLGDGYSFIAPAQTLLEENEVYHSGSRTFIMNTLESQRHASSLAGKQTMQGMGNHPWTYDQIAQNIAGFDVFTGSYLPELGGAPLSGIKVQGTYDFRPVAYRAEEQTVNHLGTVATITLTRLRGNEDYRHEEIGIAGTNSPMVKAGDKFTLSGVNAISKATKKDLGKLKTFTVRDVEGVTTHADRLQIFSISPRPINIDNANLSDLEKKYANVKGAVNHNDDFALLNDKAAAPTSIFFDKSAVEIIGGTIPAHLFKQYNQNQILEETLSNGLKVYMLYSGDVDKMTFTYRIFIWYGMVIANPEGCGCCVSADLSGDK